MGIWTGLKRAVNSTLGTANFQPLDEIIKSQRTYGASDTPLAVLGADMGFQLSTSTVQVPKIKFVPKITGSIRIKTTMKFAIQPGRRGIAYIYVYKNGNAFATISYDVAGSSDGMVNITESRDSDIPIEKGSEYTFYVKNQTTYATTTLQSIQLCAEVVDLSMLEYITY